MYDADKLYPTNYAQKTMVMERKLLSDPLAYNLYSLFKLVGKVDKEKFYRSFAAVVARQSALRTYFVEQDGEIYQKIAPQVEYETPVYKVNTLEELYNLKRSLNTPFDLEKAPLFKTALIELNDETYFFINFHHSIADGTSTAIFFQEILDIYSDKKLKEVKYTAIDYALEEKERRNILESQEQYWLNMYKDGVPPLDFPTDAPRPAVLSHKGRRLVFDIDEALAGDIKQLARKNQAAPFSVMLAAYAVLLARYSGKEDLVVGVPFAGRVQRKYAKTVGMFVNNLAWRIKPEGSKTFAEFMQEIQTEKEAVSLNQEYPLAQLVKKLELPLDMSHNSMFDAVFNFIPAFGTLKSDKIAMEFVRDDEDPSIADLAFRVNKLTKSYYIELTYSEVLFNKATMEQFSRDYIALLHEIKHNPDVELSKLKIMNEADSQKLIEFNQTAADYDSSLTMVDLLTKSVRSYPDRYVVKVKDASLTYKEFDLKTNRIAHALKEKGIGREDIVAFMLPRTSDLLCVIYGIMKAGAAFLPVDPEYPAGRIEHILTDSQAKYLITDKNADNLPEKIKQTIQLKELLSCRDESPIAEARPENLCYVIYTSGSTGKPKGVMIEHRNAVNFSCPLPNNLLSKTIAKEGKTALGIGTIAFDIALSEIFPALSNGLNFVLASEEEVNQADALGRLMLQEKVV